MTQALSEANPIWTLLTRAGAAAVCVFMGLCYAQAPRPYPGAVLWVPGVQNPSADPDFLTVNASAAAGVAVTPNVFANATLTSPPPGSMLAGGTVTFNWSAITGASAYWLDVGLVPGQGTIFGQNVGLVTSQTVSGIPTTGGTIYVRLWTQINGVWQFNDYTFTAFNGIKAVISTPTPGSFISPSTTFTWTTGTGAQAYWLDVGTVLGQGNIFAANLGLATSRTVTGIPGNGSPVYVRLWTLIAGTWSFNDYTYLTTVTPPTAVMSTPVPGSVLSGSTVTFTWFFGAGSAYWLDVGNSPGHGDIFAANVGLATTQTVSGIPTDGRTIYVRLWTLQSGGWVFQDYVYTAATVNNKAVMLTPPPGSVFTGSTVSFTWSAISGASAYWLDVGTTQGKGDIFGQNVGLATNQTVNGIPTSGATVYVRLWTQNNGIWQFNDYIYRSATLGTKAVLISPIPGSILSGTTISFTWSSGSGASAYWLDVGTVQGQGNIFAGNLGLVTSQTVSGIPPTGGTIFVRLWTLISGVWQFNDYTYTAAVVGTKAFITAPAPGSALTGSTVTFTWFPGSGATAYWLDVGTVQGQGNIFGNNVGLALSQTVTGIPTNGGPIYVRLWSQISGVWQFNDYTYTAFH